MRITLSVQKGLHVVAIVIYHEKLKKHNLNVRVSRKKKKVMFGDILIGQGDKSS